MEGGRFTRPLPACIPKVALLLAVIYICKRRFDEPIGREALLNPTECGGSKSRRLIIHKDFP
jgi:hypothetical protein